ncbi:MAG: hypothetical protein EBE86_011265 [Hormoscilla sp. GUM202]|nr:hypothetical protein [Hormoscilla sp. GUM202]
MGRSISKELSLTDAVRLGTTSSSPYLGSPTFDEVPFHVQVAALGTYVIIEFDTDKIIGNNYLTYVFLKHYGKENQ